MNRLKRHEIFLSIAGTAVFIIVMIYGYLFYFRLDITDTKAYSLTKISRSISKDIPQPVRITYYKTKGIDGIFPGTTDVIPLLDEFVRASGGKISLKIVDPDSIGDEKYFETEGIASRQVRIVRDNKKFDLKVYSTITISFLDRKKVINFVYDISSLEYQVVSAIRELVQNRRRVIGLLLGDKSRSFDKDYTMLTGTLSRDFDLVPVDSANPSTIGLNVLLVMGSRDITIKDTNEIRGFIEKGGNVFFAAEGVSVDVHNNFSAEPVKDNPLLKLLADYGVSVKNTLVIDPLEPKDLRIPKPFYGDIAWKTIGPYPEWISVRNTVSKDNPVTAHFAGVDLLWASPLSLDKEKNDGSSVLFTSSTLAWEMRDPLTTDPFTTEQYGEGKGETHSVYVLGVSIIKGNSRMIVVGDSDFLSDLVTWSESYKNMNFILDSVDWLSQNEDFMEIRTRRNVNRRLDTLDMGRSLAVYNLSAFINLVLIPVLVLIVGFIKVRRKRKQNEK